MSSFTEMDQLRIAQEKKATEQEQMSCPKCGSEYLMLREFKKYRKDFPVAPGDPAIPLTSSPAFYVLECPCGEIFEVKSIRVNVGALEKEYDKFLDQIEKSVKIKG